MKHIRKRLTYANVMSSIAVFLILGGATAVAAKKIGSNQLKPNSVTAAKIKRNAVTAKKVRAGAITTAKIAKAAVINGKLADGSVTVQKLAAGFVAPTAERLSRYANVSVGGTVLAGTLGVSQANVTHPKEGFYCLSGLSPAPVGGVATVDYSESTKDVTIQFDIGTTEGCPVGTQAFVNPRASTGVAAPVDAGFFLLLY